MAKIQVFFGGFLQSELFLDDRSIVTIGRGAECTLVIDNLAVSRCHCQLKDHRGTWIVEDLQSSNGTFLNGARIESQPLAHQDRIVIGKHTVLFDAFGLSGSEPTSASAATASADDDEGDATFFVKRDALAQFQKRSESASSMVLVMEGGRRKTVPVDKDEIVIGSGDHCDLKIAGWFVRDEQARLIKQRSYYKIIHQGGCRALRVNGSKTRESVVQVGDVISIAGNRISFGSL